MPIENPLHLFGRTTPSPAEERTLKNSASGNFTLTSKPAMDMVSVQRPDKPSPCPRCQSLDTKFCYFNNYNAKQPRHFCRKCQRYWTAGGSLRNVPVGAGRRKHKTFSSSAAPKSNLEDHDSHFDSTSHITSGMCYPSSETRDFVPASHVGGTWPHSFQHVPAVSMHAHDSHSELNVGKGIQRAAVHKPATESGYFPSYLCHDAQSDLQQMDDVSCSSGHHVDQLDGALRLWPKGVQHAQHGNEALPVDVFSDEKVGEHVPPPPSSSLSSHRSLKEKTQVEASMSTSKAFNEKTEGTPQSVWIEQVAKAMEGKTPTLKSMASHGAYGYGNATLPWSHPWMWPWLWPYANNNGQANSNIDQAAVSAAWANAVTATAASFLQISSMWNPHGWGSAPVNANNSEDLSTLGKRPRSPLHEQEPLCVPKTLKIGHPEEVVHSSILMTLGLSGPASSPASVTGFFNTNSEPKADVFQCKLTEQAQQHLQPQRLHANPAAQARSLAFQESS